MNRRRFLRATAGVALAAGNAGCLSRLGLETRYGRSPPVVEDRPDAVYVPSHVEGMEMVGVAEAGPYAVALSYSYPHRFWLVTGETRKRVDVASDDAVHLMATVWDRETGTVVPAGSVTYEVRRDGERVLRRPPWPMLSQNMGFHFGDNVALPGEGAYDVTVGVGPVEGRRTGAFRDLFGDVESTTFRFDYDRATLDEIPFRRLDEREGEPGALDPTSMGMMPSGQLPAPADLPGRPVGETTAGDARFVVRRLPEAPAGLDADGPYLAVSARTPYNRYPLPFMAVSGRMDRDGEAVYEGPLEATLDPDLGFHYGAAVGSAEPGDVLTLRVGAPPQASRHEGYETAFMAFEPTSMTVP